MTNNCKINHVMSETNSMESTFGKIVSYKFGKCLTTENMQNQIEKRNLARTQIIAIILAE